MASAGLWVTQDLVREQALSETLLCRGVSLMEVWVARASGLQPKATSHISHSFESKKQLRFVAVQHSIEEQGLDGHACLKAFWTSFVVAFLWTCSTWK